MKNRNLITVLSVATLSMTSYATAADTGGTWYHDEEKDTIVLDFPGSRDKYIAASRHSGPATTKAEPRGNWYVDDNDNIVLNIPGSRDKYIASSRPARMQADTVEQQKNWYVDEDYRVVLNFPGSRDKYLSM